MTRPPTPLLFQRSPAVRLRRESWGGLAFHRGLGDLLELDEEGFALLAFLSEPHTLPELRDALRRDKHPARLPELAHFVATLADRDFLRQVAPGMPSLAPDPWADEWQGSRNGLRAPLVAHWAVTYRCNLHCSFCYSESGPGREPGPGAAVRLRLVERLAEWGVLEVALGGGEPTILPDFPELLAAIRAAGMVPNVTTNGTAHPPSVVRALAEQAGVVHLSADRPDLLDDARGPGVFARLQETARILHQTGVRLGVNLLLTPHNVPDLLPSLQAALDLGAQAITLLRPKGAWAAAHWPDFPAARDLEPLADRLRTFLAGKPPVRLYVDTALRGEWARLGLFDDPEPEVAGCGGGQRHIAVTPEGDVYPCSHLRLPGYRMGNLLHDEMARLWTAGPGWQGRQRYRQDCEGTACPCRLTPLNMVC
jgi:radical SAM protein with 4Fe4S-binding SPASM domain